MVVNGVIRLFVMESVIKPFWVKLNRLISGEATSLCHIPEEVLEMILLRVPPKSLKRCKGVCKLWRALIHDKSFIQYQLDHHSSSKTSTTLCLNYLSFNHKQMLSLLTIHHDDNDSFSQDLRSVVEEIRLPPVPEADREYFPKRLIGSHCNGITCFIEHSSVKEEALVLCNSELGEFRIIHMPPLPKDGMEFAGAGFGFDPKSNDYKCLKVFTDPFQPNANKAIVYSLRNECWREIKIDLGSCCYMHSEGVYHKGVYYWLNLGTIKRKCTILSFDFSSEEFRKIQLPEALQRAKRNKRVRITIWNESLVVLVSWDKSRRSQTAAIEMWVMMMIGGEHRWTKHLRIAPLVHLHYPLAIWKEDELLVHSKDGQLSSCNLNRKTFRTLPLRGRAWSTHAYLYSHTLVSIKKTK